MFPEFKCDHIADIDFERFYATALGGAGASGEFFAFIAGLPLELTSKVKPLLHQVARMVWVGDRIDDLARGRPAFQVMFYLIAAELAAKLRFDFQGRGKSREYVHKFFEEICSDEHRCVLAQAFQNSGGHSLNVRKAADYLYDIRCDVVHMGSYYLSTLAHNGHRFIVQAADEPHKMMTTTFGIEQLRAIVLEGAVNAANALIQENSSLPQRG